MFTLLSQNPYTHLLFLTNALVTIALTDLFFSDVTFDILLKTIINFVQLTVCVVGFALSIFSASQFIYEECRLEIVVASGLSWNFKKL